VAAKKATVKSMEETKKATAKKTASRSADSARSTGAPPKKTSWDVLRLFMQAYEDL
jgi:hypothetical protein